MIEFLIKIRHFFAHFVNQPEFEPLIVIIAKREFCFWFLAPLAFAVLCSSYFERFRFLAFSHNVVISYMIPIGKSLTKLEGILTAIALFFKPLI